MKTGLLVGVLAAGALALASPGFPDCPAERSWAEWYDAGGGDDAAYDVVVDGKDNMIAAGAMATDEERADMGRKSVWMIRKYKGGGTSFDAAWTVTVAGQKSWGGVAKAAAVDRQNNIIVVGYEVHADHAQGNNWLIMKLDPDGKRYWRRTYNAKGDGDDWAAAVAVDPSGAIVAAGAEDQVNYGRGHDWHIRKYSSGGKLIWSASFNSDQPDSVDQATAVAVDAQGNIYVAGTEDRSHDGESTNWLVRRYSASGKVRWSRRFNSDRNGRDVPRAMAVDVYGNVYVAGVSDADDDLRRTIVVRKYRPTGELIRSFTHRSWGSMGDEVRDIAIAPDGDLIIAGSEDRDLGQERDLVIRRFTYRGSEVWARHYDAEDNNRSQAEAIALDSKKEIIVAGWNGSKKWQGMNWMVARYRPAPCLESSLAIEVKRRVNLRHLHLTLSLTNTGAMKISELKPELNLKEGEAVLVDASGPHPVGPLVLKRGEAGRFKWSYQVTAPGKVVAEVTVKGKENRDWKEVSSTASAETVLD